jgi:hypothetical protein
MTNNQFKILISLLGITDPDVRRHGCENVLDALVTIEHGSAAEGAERILRAACATQASEQHTTRTQALLARASMQVVYADAA